MFQKPMQRGEAVEEPHTAFLRSSIPELSITHKVTPDSTPSMFGAFMNMDQYESYVWDMLKKKGIEIDENWVSELPDWSFDTQDVFIPTRDPQTSCLRDTSHLRKTECQGFRKEVSHMS
jgi:hypothetical protein